MALFNDGQYRLLSAPHRVVFAGFESTTTALQQAGWKLAVEEDIRSSRIRLIMRFDPAELYMMAEEQSYAFMDLIHGEDLGRLSLTFVIRHCFSRALIELNERRFDFKQIDAEPQMVAFKPRSIEDLGIFAAPLVRTEEIIVEPQSVAECLELIRKMQAPELQAVRERNARRERLEPMNQALFHAQILSLAA